MTSIIEALKRIRRNTCSQMEGNRWYNFVPLKKVQSPVIKQVMVNVLHLIQETIREANQNR